MLSEKRNGSCGTMPIARRNVDTGRSRMSVSSTNMAPRDGSKSRGSNASSVDLPDPVGPTSARVCPGPTRADTPSSTRVPLYANDRLRNSSRPRIAAGSRVSD